MTFVHSFDPISDASANRLILGSMPGRASLLAGEYYAHPRNLFWPLMESIGVISTHLNYHARCQGLINNRIALWDVLKTCTRTSSLDSDIEEASIVVNDLASFLTSHRHISKIFFNGAKAEQVFHRHVLPELPEAVCDLNLRRLPSTSPANASVTRAAKEHAWAEVAEA